MTKILKFASLFIFISTSIAETIPEKYQDVADKLISASLSDSTAYNRLAYICDTFGPRLSGSKNLENAIDWVLAEMEKDGLSNVHGERVKVPVWIRGKESAKLIKPFAKDLAILGLFASPAVVGIYYVAQQVASLPQKLKTSFDPILGPVITRNLKENRLPAIAAQVSQVGFWIIAAQLGVSLALGLPGEAVMGLIGPEFVGGTGALAFLLMAEVAAAPAVVSEATLVYIARHRNLMVSLSVLAFQAMLTVGLLLLARHLDFPPLYLGAMPALALALSLGLMSAIKARMLTRLLAAPVGVWRWTLVWAAAAAVPTFYIFSQLPEWAELAFGIPAIMLAYGVVIWKRGFGDDDRALFRKAGEKDAKESAQEKALRKSQN